jgi:hypothetical protein
MKNSSGSYLSKPQGYQTKPQNYLLEMEDGNPVSTLTHGLYSQFEDWVALELTAEQMLGNEIKTVTTYVAGDAHQMWDAIKDTLLPYEWAAGQFLLKAADPTQVEWLQARWWHSDDAALH